MIAYYYEETVGNRALALLNGSVVFYIFGKVKFFNYQKGEGIISSLGCGSEYSFKERMLVRKNQKNIKIGDKVCVALVQQGDDFVIKKIMKNGSDIAN